MAVYQEYNGPQLFRPEQVEDEHALEIDKLKRELSFRRYKDLTDAQIDYTVWQQRYSNRFDGVLEKVMEEDKEFWNHINDKALCESVIRRIEELLYSEKEKKEELGDEGIAFRNDQLADLDQAA